MLLLALGASLSQAATVEGENVTFNLDGYYRLRMYHFNGLYDPAAWDNEPGTGRVTVQRIRLQPSVDFNGRASFHMMADAMDGVVLGDNSDLASTALFAGNGGYTGIDGRPAANFEVKRAWTRFSTPVGTMIVGRVESHWGMGLVANDGNGFKNTWGEAHAGTSFDRVMFATKPISVFSAITGKGNGDIPLFFAVGVDRLSEDPLTQYYGYDCDPEDPNDDPRCAEDDDHGSTDERTVDYRRDNWWTEHDDDVWEMAYILIYKGEAVPIGGVGTDLTAGALALNRRQPETDSNVWILDGHVKFQRKWMYLESEGYMITGSSRAIVLPGGPAEDPLYKEVGIYGGVVRGGYNTEDLSLILETGWASGDDDVADPSFTGRPMNRDYNVGLILYDQVIERVTRYSWGDVDGLYSNGGVYNSMYVFPSVRYQLIPGWNLHAAFLAVQPHKPDGARIAFDDDSDARLLGWEVDAALKIDFQEHMRFSTEAGYARVTDRLPVEQYGLTKDGAVWTVQSRIAYEF